MDYLSLIKKPIENDLNDFIELFNRNLSHDDGLLSSALTHIRQRGGKRMRPMLILLTAKNYGAISDVTQHAAVGLELLHTASLVHDDVVDESEERRGQASVNASYNNKVAVLVGDYILSSFSILLNWDVHWLLARFYNSRIFRIRSLVRRFTIRSSTRRLQLSSRLALPLALSLQGLLMKILKRLLNLVRHWVLCSRFVMIFLIITTLRKLVNLPVTIWRKVN